MEARPSWIAQFESQMLESRSSDRSFGLLLGSIFLIVGLYKYRAWAIGVGILLLLLAWLAPSVLNIPKVGWLFLGFCLGKVVNPVVLGVLFFGVITPIGLVIRVLRMDLLRLRWEPRAETYWIRRRGPASSMRDQF